MKKAQRAFTLGSARHRKMEMRRPGFNGGRCMYVFILASENTMMLLHMANKPQFPIISLIVDECECGDSSPKFAFSM